jgi:hypothetical protein
VLSIFVVDVVVIVCFSQRSFFFFSFAFFFFFVAVLHCVSDCSARLLFWISFLFVCFIDESSLTRTEFAGRVVLASASASWRSKCCVARVHFVTATLKNKHKIFHKKSTSSGVFSVLTHEHQFASSSGLTARLLAFFIMILFHTICFVLGIIVL